MKQEKDTFRAIADRIKKRRLELGYSYQALADITGMNKSSLQRYETGGIPNIPLRRLETIAHALDVSPLWIMGWDINTPEERYTITPAERALLDKINALPPEKRAAILALLD